MAKKKLIETEEVQKKRKKFHDAIHASVRVQAWARMSQTLELGKLLNDSIIKLERGIIKSICHSPLPDAVDLATVRGMHEAHTMTFDRLKRLHDAVDQAVAEAEAYEEKIAAEAPMFKSTKPDYQAYADGCVEDYMASHEQVYDAMLAYKELCSCYRLSKEPSDSLHARLELAAQISNAPRPVDPDEDDEGEGEGDESEGDNDDLDEILDDLDEILQEDDEGEDGDKEEEEEEDQPAAERYCPSCDEYYPYDSWPLDDGIDDKGKTVIPCPKCGSVVTATPAEHLMINYPDQPVEGQWAIGQQVSFHAKANGKERLGRVVGMSDSGNRFLIRADEGSRKKPYAVVPEMITEV